MKKIAAIFLALLTAASCASCGGAGGESAGQTSDSPKAPADAQTPGEAVIIPLLAGNGGNDSNTEFLKSMIEKFDTEYEGRYKIEVEWIPGVSEDVRAKLKMLNAANDLPALVGELGAEPALADLMMRNNRLLDLKPYFDADPAWQEVCIPESVEYNTRDGKMYTSPSVSASYAGMFYNKEMFKAAGIDAFPQTLDAFWEACDKLTAAGYTPLSLHTTETGWCPMLVATSRLGLSEEGKKFISQMYPTDFNTPELIESMELLKRLFTYSTTDAVGGNYALAANNFCSEKTAMIPNGPWMIPGLRDPNFAPEGFADKVGYAAFPDNIMVTTGGTDNYGYGVSMDHPKEVQEGTVEYIKFLARPDNVREACVVKGEIAPKVELEEEDLARMDPIMVDYSQAVNALSGTVPSYQGHWDPITQNEVIPTELVNFITGKITAEELIAKMSAAGTKYAAEGQ